jgi:hypothetical protein
VPQLIRRGADVRPDGIPHELILVVADLARDERLDGRSNAVDDRAQILRLVDGKLEVNSRGEAVYEAVNQGLIRMDE